MGSGGGIYLVVARDAVGLQHQGVREDVGARGGVDALPGVRDGDAEHPVGGAALGWPALSLRKVAGKMPWVALATRARRWVQREPAVVGRAPPWAASAVGWKVATTCTAPPGPCVVTCVATEGVGWGKGG